MDNPEPTPTQRYLASLSPGPRAAAVSGLRNLLHLMHGGGKRERWDVTQYDWHLLTDDEVSLLLSTLACFPARSRGRYGGTMLIIAKRTLKRIKQIAAEMGG